MLAVAADPFDTGIAYAGTSDGIYRTTDLGRTWHRRSSLTESVAVRWLAADSSRPGRLFALANWGAHAVVIRSDDGGRTWRTLEVPGGTPHWVQVAGRPARLYVVTADERVARSDDGGETWESLPLADTEALAVSPSDPAIVYRSTAGQLRRSSDGARSWSPCGGPPPGTPHLDSRELAVDPVDPDTVYSASQSAVIRSDDGCASWTHVSSRPVGYFDRLVADIAQSGRLFLLTHDDLVVSSDGARTWRSIAPEGRIRWFRDLGQSLLAPQLMWLAGDALSDGVGLLASTEGGRTWSPQATGLVASSAPAIVPVGADPVVVYAGFSRSDDLGATWTRMSGPDDLWWVAAAAPSDPDVLYAAGERDALYCSGDGGRSWETVLPATGGARWIRSVSVDPTNAETLVMCVDDYGSPVAALRSEDGGRSWAPLSTLPEWSVYRVVFAADRPGMLWAATPGGPYRSLDDGVTWLFHGDGLEAPQTAPPMLQFSHWGVFDIVQDPAEPSRWLAGACNGVWESLDDGVSWHESREGLAICSELENLWHPWCADQAAKPSRPLVCTGGPTRLRFDPVDPSTVIAATPHGAFRSLNGGATWTPLTSGRGHHPVTDAAPLGDGRFLAGTDAAGVLTWDEHSWDDPPARPSTHHAD